MQDQAIVLGWREWLTLPQLGIARIKAKVDSGARTSSLRVEFLEEYERGDARWLRFAVRPLRRAAAPVVCEAPAVDRREVCDSGGHVTRRWFIRTELALAGCRWPAEINLTPQSDMLFPLLLGRTALAGRFVIDPAASYRCGRPRRRRRPPPGETA